MRRHRPRLAPGVAIVGALAAAACGLLPAAQADTIGGEQLSSTHRTVSLLPGADPLPDVWAETWIVADATTGEVLAQKGSHVQRAPASTLKMLTAVTVMPNTTPEQTYVATPFAASIYGARVGLRPGKTYTLDELWYAVFLPSANDAAIAVAQANGGVKKTVNGMNVVARTLQANDTVAKNTNGLDAPGQVSSSYDLALIARAGLARPDFAKYAGTDRAMFPDVKGKGKHPIYTTNRLLLHGFKGMIGVKTGFTSQAGRTYVGAAKRGHTTLLVALMGVHEASETAARKLLVWGFANQDRVTPIGQLVEPLAASPEGTMAAVPDGAPTADQPSAATSLVASAGGDAPASRSMAILWGGGALLIGGAAVLAVRSRQRHSTVRGRHAASREESASRRSQTP